MPRDASSVSVIFGNDRGQVFGVVAARATASATAPAAAAAFVIWVPLVAVSRKNTKQGFCVLLRSYDHISPCKAKSYDARGFTYFFVAL